MLTLELNSSTLPPGKKVVLNLKDAAAVADTKKNPIIIKEGVEYKCVVSSQGHPMNRNLILCETLLVSASHSKSIIPLSRYVQQVWREYRGLIPFFAGRSIYASSEAGWCQR